VEKYRLKSYKLRKYIGSDNETSNINKYILFLFSQSCLQQQDSNEKCNSDEDCKTEFSMGTEWTGPFDTACCGKKNLFNLSSPLP